MEGSYTIFRWLRNVVIAFGWRDDTAIPFDNLFATRFAVWLCKMSASMAGTCYARNLTVRAVVPVLMLLRVTVFMRIGVEFFHAILRVEIERATFMLPLCERLL